MKEKEEYEYSVFDTLSDEKLKELYANADVCVTADLFRDGNGNIYVFRYIMTAHGTGQDHTSCVVKSSEELRTCLLDDVSRGWVSQKTADRLCRECRHFFE